MQMHSGERSILLEYHLAAMYSVIVGPLQRRREGTNFEFLWRERSVREGGKWLFNLYSKLRIKSPSEEGF